MLGYEEVLELQVPTLWPDSYAAAFHLKGGMQFQDGWITWEGAFLKGLREATQLLRRPAMPGVLFLMPGTALSRAGVAPLCTMKPRVTSLPR